jgi:hypothetical protein
MAFDDRYEFDAPNYFDFAQLASENGSSFGELTDEWFDGREEDEVRHGLGMAPLLTEEEVATIRLEREEREREAALHKEAALEAQDAEAVAWTRAAEAAYEAEALAETAREHTACADVCDDDVAAAGQLLDLDQAGSGELPDTPEMTPVRTFRLNPDASRPSSLVQEQFEPAAKKENVAPAPARVPADSAMSAFKEAERAAQAYINQAPASVSLAAPPQRTSQARRAQRPEGARGAVDGSAAMHSSGATRIVRAPVRNEEAPSGAVASSGPRPRTTNYRSAQMSSARQAATAPRQAAPRQATASQTRPRATAAKTRTRVGAPTSYLPESDRIEQHSYRRPKVESTEERIIRERKEAQQRLRQHTTGRQTQARATRGPSSGPRSSKFVPRKLTKPRSPQFASAVRSVMHSSRTDDSAAQAPRRPAQHHQQQKAETRTRRPVTQVRRTTTKAKPFSLSTSSRSSRMRDERSERPLRHNFKSSGANRATANVRQALGVSRISRPSKARSPQKFYGIGEGSAASQPRRRSQLTIPRSPQFSSASRAEHRASLSAQREADAAVHDFSEFAGSSSKRDRLSSSGRLSSGGRRSSVAFGSSFAATPSKTPTSNRRGSTAFKEFSFSTETRSRQRRARDEQAEEVFGSGDYADFAAEQSYLGHSRSQAKSRASSTRGSLSGQKRRSKFGVASVDAAPRAEKRARVASWEPAADEELVRPSSGAGRKMFGGRLRQALNAIRNA